ncbi:MAG: hypothetical protein ACYCYE_10760 [Clostridia bacterium]
MENKEKPQVTFENNIADINADMKKARLVSSIIEKAEQGEEEVNKGRS